MGFRVVGTQAQSLPVVSDGFGTAAEAVEDEPEPLLGEKIKRVDPHGLCVIAPRFFVAALTSQDLR